MSDPNDLFAAAAPSPEDQTPASASAKAPAKSRQPLLKEKPNAPEPPAKAPVPPHAAARLAAAKAPNVSQSRVSRGAFLAAFGLLFVLLLGAIGGAVWFYESRILPELRSHSTPPAPSPTVDTAPLQAALQQANARVAELQKQMDAQREERERTQGRLQEMADRMALVIQQSSFIPKNSAPAQVDSTGAQMPALLPSVSPSTSELILLKERNRLTGFADAAIASGDRASLQRIVDVLLDPEQKNMAHAAQAEFKRVQSYYEISSSIDPGYKLPVQELFKNTPVIAEADLTGEQLQKLMLDAKQPWEVRLRCAYLLRGSNTAGTDEALLKVIKEDPSLDVAKQAQTTFERRVGRRFRLFDIPSIEAWWQAQGSVKATPVPMKEPAR